MKNCNYPYGNLTPPPQNKRILRTLLTCIIIICHPIVISGMRSETLEEVELTGVRPSLPAVRTFTRGNTGVEEVYVDTDNGPVCVAVQGDRSKPPILTYHDLGLNCKHRHWKWRRKHGSTERWRVFIVGSELWCSLFSPATLGTHVDNVST